MAVTFLEPGTDATQDFSFFASGVAVASGSGAVTSATDQARTGLRSIKCVTSIADTDEAYVITPNGVVADAGALISFGVRLSTISFANPLCFMGVTAASDGLGIFNLGIDTTNTLLVGGRNATTGITKLGSTVLSANTWYRVSLGYVLTTTTNWSLVVYLNGISEITLSNADGTLTATTTSDAFFGLNDKSALCGFAHSPTATVWIDDIYVDNRTDKTDSGDVHVTAKLPIANGTTNGFTTQIGAGGSGTGTGHSPQVNERPLSQTNGWSMVGAGSAVTEEYNVQARSAGDVDLTGLTLYDWMGWVFAKSLASETASIVVGGATSNISLTSTPTAFMKAAGSTTYPAGSGTDVGIVTTTALTTVSLYECGVIVAYNPTPPVIVFVPHQTYMAGILTQ